MRKWYAENVQAGTEYEFIRSDGAGSHFKNKYTMRWLACNRGILKRSTWCIGCPGSATGIQLRH
jgi:hypothetical protein